MVWKFLAINGHDRTGQTADDGLDYFSKIELPPGFKKIIVEIIW